MVPVRSPISYLNPSQLVHPPDISNSNSQADQLPAQHEANFNMHQKKGTTSTLENPNLQSLSEFPILSSNFNGKQEASKSFFSKSWKDVITENKYHGNSTQLAYYEPSMKNNVRCAHIEEQLIIEARKKWQYSVAFYVYGNKPYYKYLKEYIDRSWQINGSYQLYTRENGFFIIKLDTQDDCERLLAGGPYFYNKKLIFMKKWFPGMKLSKESLHTLPTWIRLPNLDLDFWSTEAISRIASVLGHPVKLDQITEELIRISYARVLVEVDVNCTFPSEIPILCCDGKIIGQKVIYEWKPTVCSNCKIFGHLAQSCLTKKVWKQKETLNQDSIMEVDNATQANNNEDINVNNNICGMDYAQLNSELPNTDQQETIDINVLPSIHHEKEQGMSTVVNNERYSYTPLQKDFSTENSFEALLSDPTDDIQNNSDNLSHNFPLPEDLKGISDHLDTRETLQTKEERLNNSFTITEKNGNSQIHTHKAQDIIMEETNVFTESYKKKRNTINLNNCNDNDVIIEGEPFVVSNPKWNDLVSQLKTKSKNKKHKEDNSLLGGVKSKGISKK